MSGLKIEGVVYQLKDGDKVLIEGTHKQCEALRDSIRHDRCLHNTILHSLDNLVTSVIADATQYVASNGVKAIVGHWTRVPTRGEILEAMQEGINSLREQHRSTGA